jgi:hypothetical protein
VRLDGPVPARKQRGDAEPPACHGVATRRRSRTRPFLNRKDAKNAKPARPGVEPQRHRGTERDTEHLTRAFIAWRGPGRRTTAGDLRTGQRLRSQAIVDVAMSSSLLSRRAQASPLLILCWWKDGAPLFKKRRGEAEPTRPGRVGWWEARRRRTLASGVDVLPTGGRRSSDRRQFRWDDRYGASQKR